MLLDRLFHLYQLIFKADSQSFVIKLITGITVILCSHTLQSVENQSSLVLYYMRLNCNVLFNSIHCYIRLKFQLNFLYGPILWEPLWIGYGIKIMCYMQNKLRDHSFPDPRYCNSILRHGGVWQRDTSQVWPSQEWLAGRQRGCWRRSTTEVIGQHERRM